MHYIHLSPFCLGCFVQTMIYLSCILLVYTELDFQNLREIRFSKYARYSISRMLFQFGYMHSYCYTTSIAISFYDILANSIQFMAVYETHCKKLDP